MIIDKIKNAGIYSLGDKFTKAFNFIHNCKLATMPPGKYEILDDQIYASINEYSTRNLSEGKIEGHKRYIDLQYIIRGEEYIGYTPKNKQEILTPYDSDKDFIFYEGDITLFPMKEEMFMILFPDDLHMPGIKINESIPVKKLVIKIAV